MPVLIFSLLLLQAPVPAPLPDGNAYVRSLAGKQRLREEQLNDYTYDVERVKEELDGEGRVEKRRQRRFEVFFVKGKSVRRLVAKDDRALTPAEQEDEDRRAREKTEAITSGQVASELPTERLSAILQRYDFRALGRETLDGRATLVFDFEPLPGKRALDSDHVLRALKGRLWVDEEEQEVVRMHVRNGSSIRFALGIGASVSSLDSTIEFRKVADAVWLPRRDEMTASGRLLLLKRFRTRVTHTYGNYHRFEVDAHEGPSASPAPPPSPGG